MNFQGQLPSNWYFNYYNQQYFLQLKILCDYKMFSVQLQLQLKHWTQDLINVYILSIKLLNLKQAMA